MDAISEVKSRLTFLWWPPCWGIIDDGKNWTKIGMTQRAPNLPPSPPLFPIPCFLNLRCHNWYEPSSAPALATQASINLDFSTFLALCSTPPTVIWWCQIQNFCAAAQMWRLPGALPVAIESHPTLLDTHVDLSTLIGLLYLTCLSEEPAGNC